jgi:hypothetical protein
MVDFSGTSDFYRIKQAAAFTADGRVIQKKNYATAHRYATH